MEEVGGSGAFEAKEEDGGGGGGADRDGGNEGCMDDVDW
jgi:hypothetical protein